MTLAKAGAPPGRLRRADASGSKQERGVEPQDLLRIGPVVGRALLCEAAGRGARLTDASDVEADETTHRHTVAERAEESGVQAKNEATGGGLVRHSARARDFRQAPKPQFRSHHQLQGSHRDMDQGAERQDDLHDGQVETRRHVFRVHDVDRELAIQGHHFVEPATQQGTEPKTYARTVARLALKGVEAEERQGQEPTTMGRTSGRRRGIGAALRRRGIGAALRRRGIGAALRRLIRRRRWGIAWGRGAADTCCPVFAVDKSSAEEPREPRIAALAPCSIP